jgi:hypothetical protein
MKRTFAVLSFVLVLTFAATAQSTTQPKAEQLSRKQLNALIDSAKTPAEHIRIAAYFEAMAADFRAEAREHEAMVAAYKANSTLATDKNRTSTIGHCQYFVTTLNERADHSLELAKQHERMASDASGQ